MKRTGTCYGCKALDSDWCNLGFRNRRVYNPKRRLYEIKPEEDCPKPMTYERWLKLKEGGSQ